MSATSDLSKQVWLLLLARGGWWSAREVELELVVTQGSLLPRMRRMHQFGSLQQRREGDNRRTSFSVAPGCSIPQGVTVLEVQEALSDEGSHRPYRGLPAHNGNLLRAVG